MEQVGREHEQIVDAIARGMPNRPRRDAPAHRQQPRAPAQGAGGAEAAQG
jgi:hypothetical protein